MQVGISDVRLHISHRNKIIIWEREKKKERGSERERERERERQREGERERETDRHNHKVRKTLFHLFCLFFFGQMTNSSTRHRQPLCQPGGKASDNMRNDHDHNWQINPRDMYPCIWIINLDFLYKLVINTNGGGGTYSSRWWLNMNEKVVLHSSLWYQGIHNIPGVH